MKRPFGTLAALSLLFLLPHCPPARTPDPTQEPGESDAGALPVLSDAAPGSVESDAADADVSPDANDAALAVSDASLEAAAVPSPVCRPRVLGQHLKSALCTSDAQCRLRAPDCCAPCGEVPIKRVRAVSITDDLACGGIGCGKCASWMPANVQARCVGRRCSVVQSVCGDEKPACPALRKPKLLPRLLDPKFSICQKNDECVLGPVDCCHCGLASGDAVVSRNRRVPYACSGNCPDCVSDGVDPSLAAVCVGGRCRVKDLGLDPNCSSPLQ